MKANELRIGNWIKEPIESGGKIGQVKRIETDKDGYSHYLDHCSPIPLTEEWLLKFGFIKHITTDVHPTFAKGNINVNDNIVYVSGYGFINHIKHVHQLQNLYFALTGEELTV